MCASLPLASLTRGDVADLADLPESQPSADQPDLRYQCFACQSDYWTTALVADEALRYTLPLLRLPDITVRQKGFRWGHVIGDSHATG